MTTAKAKGEATWCDGCAHTIEACESIEGECLGREVRRLRAELERATKENAAERAEWSKAMRLLIDNGTYATSDIVPSIVRLIDERDACAEREQSAIAERDVARRDRNRAEDEARNVPRDMFPSAASSWDKLRAERDAALARATVAEGDRDSWREQYRQCRVDLETATRETEAAQVHAANIGDVHVGLMVELCRLAEATGVRAIDGERLDFFAKRVVDAAMAKLAPAQPPTREDAAQGDGRGACGACCGARKAAK